LLEAGQPGIQAICGYAGCEVLGLKAQKDHVHLVVRILYQHPAVLEAALLGIPDPYWVEKVHAVVVLQAGVSAKGQEIIDFCKARLAGFKTPKAVEFLPSIPRDPAGKILKRRIRQRYWKGPDRSI
jgi:acyl-CoA synthetase (AMP-forming)/AMP-acid ligase II